MAALAQSGPVLRFGVFELDVEARELRKNGARVRLQGQPLEVLQLLVERAGEVVTREEIRQRLWTADTFVDFDHSLNNAVARIREALGDSASAPRFVETIPRRGWRFLPHVDVVRTEPAQEPPAVPADEPAKGAPRPWRTRLIAAAGLVCILAALAAITWRLSKKETGRIHSIAVLPLDNFSGDPSQDYFADGMTDELITNLAKIESLRVVSRTSVMRYKSTRIPLRQIAQELQADAIVEGSVSRSGKRVRITAQLIRASDDRHLWAQDYEREMTDVLSVQSDIARSIADEIHMDLTSDQQRRLTPRPVSPEAYDHVLKGRYYMNRLRPQDLNEAVREFQAAIAIDPNYAMAYAGLADTYCWRVSMGNGKEDEDFPLARDAAVKALAEDSTLASPHKVLGWVQHKLDWDTTGAEREFELALRLDNKDAAAHAWYGIFLSQLNREAEAIAEAKRAEELEPLSAHVAAMVAVILVRARHYAEATSELERTRQLEPEYPFALNVEQELAEQTGNYDAAIAKAERRDEIKGVTAPVAQRRAAFFDTALRERGERGYWTAVLKDSMGDGTRARWPMRAAIAAAELGDRDAALIYLNDACHFRDSSIRIFLLADPRLDPLRSDARFQAIRRCAGFE